MINNTPKVYDMHKRAGVGDRKRKMAGRRKIFLAGEPFRFDFIIPETGYRILWYWRNYLVFGLYVSGSNPARGLVSWGPLWERR